MEESKDQSLTLGQLVAKHRAKLGLSLKELSARTLQQDGRPVSAQYLHDIEYDRRVPSSALLPRLAAALELEPAYVFAFAGRPLAEVTEYLTERPGCAAAVARLFAKARADGFSNWDGVAVEPRKPTRTP